MPTKKVVSDFYNYWRKVNSFCPTLNTTVYISRKGWNHLFNEHTKLRSSNDIKRRLSLIFFAKEIIEDAESKVTFHNKNEYKFIALSGIRTVKGERIAIKVILQIDNKGKYIFLSVMDKRKN